MKCWKTLRLWSALVVAAAPGLVHAQTGPANQTVPWQNPANSYNSVVQMLNGAFAAPGAWGSGSIIDKKIVGGVGWLCVLTADHVITNGAGNAANGLISIGFGDGNPPAQGTFGGAGGIIKRGWLPVAQGGLGGADLAVVGIPYGAITPANQAFFNNITPLTMRSSGANLGTFVSSTMSQIGYGGTGNLVATGMQFTAYDDTKRFQNNRLERTANANYTTNGVNYNYTGIEFDFDDPAGVFDVPGEGTSYPADSGSPYLTLTSNSFSGINVFSQGIVAVHGYGNAVATAGVITPFWTAQQWSGGGGTPLTQANIDWITAQCMMIPSGSTVSVLFITGIFAARRRRAA